MYSVCIVNTSSLCIFNADKTSRIAKAVVGGVVVGGLAVVAAPLVLSAAGFSAGGIVEESLSAKLMSAPAIASGGSECLWFDRSFGMACIQHEDEINFPCVYLLQKNKMALSLVIKT